jgi:hypothetical protein
LLPYRIDIRISIIWCISDRSLQCSSASVFSLKTAVLSWGLRGRYTTVHFSSSSAKRLKESDLVRDLANSLFLCQFLIKSFSVFLKLSKLFYNNFKTIRKYHGKRRNYW